MFPMVEIRWGGVKAVSIRARGGTILSLQIGIRAAATSLLATIASPAVAEDTSSLMSLRQAAINLSNAARAEAGLPDLNPSDILDQAAQDHAADMLERNYYDHITPDGDTPFDRFIAAGGNSWALSGENIATCEGCPSPPDTSRVRGFHEGWMQSPGHRENILSEGFESFGFGIAAEGNKVYAVQTFSGPGADAGDGSSTPLTHEAARALALAEINMARTAEGLDPLEPSDALHTVATRVLDRLADAPEALPENIFGLLPEGSTGWTSLAVQTSTVGGSGSTLTGAVVLDIVSRWVSASETRPRGGTEASHFGFSAVAIGDGRSTAVAVFAGRS